MMFEELFRSIEMRVSVFFATATALAISSPALAQSAFWSDTTAGAPTFSRPSSFTGHTGDAHRYHVQPFWVDAAGEYVYESSTHNPATGQGWDGFILAYIHSFDPANPLVNLIAGNDDKPPGPFMVLPGSSTSWTRASQIALGNSQNFGGPTTGFHLTAGVQYYAVQTGLWEDAGVFWAGIGAGPGSVYLGIVPAPGAAVLIAFGAVVASRRRR
jgi:hypothetical protein